MRLFLKVLLSLILLSYLNYPDSGAATDYPSQMEEVGLPVVNSMIGGTGLRPRSFRSSEIVPFGRLKQINTEGLDSLHVSGSSQPSPNEMDEVKKFWGKRRVHWIALRKEEVVAVEPKDGGAIVLSLLHRLKWWSGEDARGQISVDQIHAAERAAIEALKQQEKVTLFGNRDLDPSLEKGEAYELWYGLNIDVDKVYTLQELVEKRGMIYHRVIDNKFGPISWDSIDHLVSILKEVPVNDAVHMHCKKGQSRTTIAMVIFDMMRNADKVRGEEIIRRQGPFGLGGASLEADQVTPGKGGTPYKDSWEKILLTFYDYCLANKASNYAVAFSVWCEQNGIARVPEISLEPFSHDLTITSMVPETEEGLFDPQQGQDTNVAGPLVLTVLDEKKLLPNNLRSTQDHYFNPSFNAYGLNKYYVVASSQPTLNGAKTLFKQLKIDFPSKKIIVVDLRHDEHWLVINGELGHDVNSFETFSELGTDIEAKDLLEKENRSAAFLSSQKALKLHVIKEKYPKDDYGDKYHVILAPTQVLTEQKVMQNLGVDYVRIPAARFGSILDANVDEQIQLRKANPDSILYYHCKNGKSRTTLALCIEDMMVNADTVSMPDIVRRQNKMGGSNLFDITAKDPSWHQEREFKRQWLIFLARFHAYCQAEKGNNFSISWSEWSSAHPGLPDYLPWDMLEKLIIDNTSKM